MSKPISITRYLSMQLLAAAVEDPEQAVCGVVNYEKAKNGQLKAIAFKAMGGDIQQLAVSDDSWVFWQQPGHAPELTIDDVELLPTAALYLVISLNIKGVLEMKAWRIDQGQPVEVAIEVMG